MSKKIIKKRFIIYFCAVLLCACTRLKEESQVSSSEDTSSDKKNADFQPVYRKISAEEARNIMLSNENAIVLDVRTDEEFEEKRIDGAILIPDFELKERAESELSNKNAILLVYCRSGRRSEIAARELVAMGYSNVYDFGGILDWPYETVSN